MAVLKCKMCGGDIIAAEGQTYGVCDSCGSTVTLPRVEDQRMENLFNRANHFRMISEFDKAVATYEMILNEDNANAEAHWGLLISRYGIEYVEDPTSHERIPTCHRIQHDSILADSDYLAALQYAPDKLTHNLYETEGKRLSDLQRGLLQVSAQTEPFDIFICYKETTEGGSRTKDSALAQDIYYQLTNAGYKVFFSRVTLESMLGQQYEPHIFAALNSAKVMLAIGTKPEYFNAVWVKNEWSRFLALSRKDRSKVLIPCYMDLNVYDLPDELSMLQSQDMSKIGFIQDLLRGIEKVVRIQKPEEKKEPERAAAAPGVESLLKRAVLFLEDGDFKSADEYAEKVLDIDPEYAPAYMIKVQVAEECRRESELAACEHPLTENADYQKALRFAKPQQKAIYESYNQRVLNEIAYKKADEILKAKKWLYASTYAEAAAAFTALGDYKDSQERAAEYRELERKTKELEAERARREEAERIERARQDEERRLENERLLEQQKIAREAQQKVQQKIALAASGVVAVFIVAVLLYINVLKPRNAYNAAVALFEAEQYDEAISAFDAIDGYGDSYVQIQRIYYAKGEESLEQGALQKAREMFAYAETMAADEAVTLKAQQALAQLDSYENARQLYKDGKVLDAIAQFKVLGNYLDSTDRLNECYAEEYARANELYNQGDYQSAYDAYKSIAEYEDCAGKAQKIEDDYQKAEKLLSEGTYDEASALYASLKNYKNSEEKKQSSIYMKAETLFASASYDEAIAVYSMISTYSDATLKISDCHYQKAMGYLANGQQYDAEAEFELISGYSDADAQLAALRLNVADTAYSEKNYALSLEYYLKLEQTEETKGKEYTLAQTCYDEGHFEQAVQAYETLGQYELSISKLPVARYAYASQLFDNAEYDKAAEQFSLLNGSTDSAERAQESTYYYACSLRDAGSFDDAKVVFRDLGEYSDAQIQVTECDYRKAAAMMSAGQYEQAGKLFGTLGGYSDSAEQEKECYYQNAESLFAAGEYEEAQKWYQMLNVIENDAIVYYKNSEHQITMCFYNRAEAAFAQGDYFNSGNLYYAAGEYENSEEMKKESWLRLGRAFYEDGDYENALFYLKDLDYADSDILTAQCYCEQGKAYLAEGNPDEAVQKYARATMLPEAQEMLYSLGKDYASMNQNEKAIETLWAAGEYEPAKNYLKEIAGVAKNTGNMAQYFVACIAGGFEAECSEELVDWKEIADQLTTNLTDDDAMYTETIMYAFGGKLLVAGEYDAAAKTFEYVTGYSDAAIMAQESVYQNGTALLAAGEYDAALVAFESIAFYKDSDTMAQESMYQKGLALLEAGKHSEGIEIFLTLKGYKDVETLIAETEKLLAEKAVARNAAFEVGNYVTFGNYPQMSDGDDDTSIEWLVLKREGNRALLISRYGLDCQRYNDKHEDVTWETCTMRSWLNDNFLTQAFSTFEQSGILTTTIAADLNPSHNTNPGNTTQDKVFLLSIIEAEALLDSDDARICTPTDYADNQGIELNDEMACWWWLRSPGLARSYAAYIVGDGYVSDYGRYVSSEGGAVRPALWVDIESGVF